MTDEQAWAAGLFDGKGTITKGRMALRSIDRAMVERFADAVGCGKVYGPYASGGLGTQPVHVWQVARAEDRAAVFVLLEPLLSPRRREQWPVALSVNRGTLVP